MVNPNTLAWEMTALAHEVRKCHAPLVMTKEMMAVRDLPTPPNPIPSTPPPRALDFYARIAFPSTGSSPATPRSIRMEGPDPKPIRTDGQLNWVVGA